MAFFWCSWIGRCHGRIGEREGSFKRRSAGGIFSLKTPMDHEASLSGCSLRNLCSPSTRIDNVIQITPDGQPESAKFIITSVVILDYTTPRAAYMNSEYTIANLTKRSIIQYVRERNGTYAYVNLTLPPTMFLDASSRALQTYGFGVRKLNCCLCDRCSRIM